MREKKPLLHIRPEEAGIEPSAILRFLDRLEAREICMHSFLILRGGRIAAEGYWAPYTKERLHRIYSASKSLVSVAVGLLEAEGRLSLDDTAASFFPEYVPAGGAHPFVMRATVRDLLRMRSPFEEPPYDRHPDLDWMHAFFLAEGTHMPGTVFSYDSSATVTLTALAEKCSGMPFIEYLRPRVLDPIGFSENAYCAPCPDGILSHGASGVMCTTRDLAKFALLCLHGGAREGRQLIPAQYLKEAVSFQSDTSLCGHEYERAGYGYQFWRCRGNGFMLCGMKGQLAVCLPEQDFVLVTTADTGLDAGGEQAIFDALWEELLPALGAAPRPKDESAYRVLLHRLASLALPALAVRHPAPPLSDIHETVFHFDENETGLRSCSFSFGESGAVWRFAAASGEADSFMFGFGHTARGTLGDTGMEYLASGAWTEASALRLRISLFSDEIGTAEIWAAFFSGGVTLRIRRAAENMPLGFSDGFASGFADPAPFTD